MEEEEEGGRMVWRWWCRASDLVAWSIRNSTRVPSWAAAASWAKVGRGGVGLGMRLGMMGAGRGLGGGVSEGLRRWLGGFGRWMNLWVRFLEKRGLDGEGLLK